MGPVTDPLLDAFVAELVAEHGRHAVVLYGPCGPGDWPPASDFDRLGVRGAGAEALCAEVWR